MEVSEMPEHIQKALSILFQDFPSSELIEAARTFGLWYGEQTKHSSECEGCPVFDVLLAVPGFYECLYDSAENHEGISPQPIVKSPCGFCASMMVREPWSLDTAYNEVDPQDGGPKIVLYRDLSITKLRELVMQVYKRGYDRGRLEKG